MSNNNESLFTILGWCAAVTAAGMYVSYIPQIIKYWGGETGDYIQPFVAGVNCTLWVIYGFFKPHRDIPLALSNLPGILFGFMTAFLAFFNS